MTQTEEYKKRFPYLLPEEFDDYCDGCAAIKDWECGFDPGNDRDGCAQCGVGMLFAKVAELEARAVPDAIARELVFQKKWGGAVHDDEHTADDWAHLIDEELHEAAEMRDDGFEHQAKEVAQVAALALAWFYSLERKRAAEMEAAVAERQAIDAAKENK